MPNLADRAAQFLDRGIREIAGPSSHPQILEWLHRAEHLYPTDLAIDDSKYAWCGVFVGNMVLDSILAGESLPPPPKYFQAAVNWRKWGVPTKSPKKGDVVVISRPGGFHVAIAEQFLKDSFRVIGGNQGDAVSRAAYPNVRIVEVRAAA